MTRPAFCRVDKSRKHRVHQWMNTDTLDPVFGIQANLAPGKWVHVIGPSKDDPSVYSPLLFATESEAAGQINEWASQ